MAFRTRTTAAALVLGVALGTGACTPRDTSPSDPTATSSQPSPSPATPPTSTSDPDDVLAVVGAAGEVERSLGASRALFDSAPVAVVAPAGQVEAQRLAAHVSVQLGVPLLVGTAAEPATDPVADPSPAPSTAPPTDESADAPSGTPTADPSSDPADRALDPAVSAELERLGVATVVEVGDVVGLDPSRRDGADDGDGLDVVHAEAAADALAEATGLQLGAGAAGDPAGYPAVVAALAPGVDGTGQPSSAAADDPDTAADDAPLPRVERDRPLEDTVALAVDQPAELAPIATARAAGVPVHLVPASAPNPQATSSVVEALHASPATRVLALGAALGAQAALDWKIRSARTGYQLPGGGQVPFPRHQFIALYGTPVTSALGVLGEQDLQASLQRARDTAAQYAGLTDRTAVPMFEIIATVAAAGAGADGNYSNEQPIEVLRPWVEAAGAAGIQVVLDLQPGRSDFLTQAQQYEELLRLPHVGLALDPEWRLGPDEVPLQRIGSVGAAEVNTVVSWLADLTDRNDLPPKLLVLHQFQLRMISDRASVDTSRPQLQVVLHVDGQGSQSAKQDTWRTLQQGAPAGVGWGWKNFVDEDSPMLTPQQTVQVAPLPDLVTYQ